MANTSKVGTKNVLGGFVGNKRILEEFIYENFYIGDIDSSSIPYTLQVNDYTTLEQLGWQKESFLFFVYSFDKTMRQVDWRFETVYFKKGNNYDFNSPFVFKSGSFIFYDSIGPQNTFYDEVYDTTYFSFIVNSFAKYTEAEWDYFYSETVEIRKKQIYTMIPYSWKTTTTTTPDFNYTTLNELKSNKPACKVFENKVAKVDNRSFVWVEISEEGFFIYLNEGYTEIRVPAYGGDEIPDASYLPPARDYEGTHTIAVVYNMLDQYPPKFFIFSQLGGLNYYKCLPD